MEIRSPRVEIYADRIAYNVEYLQKQAAKNNISLVGVTKGVLADHQILDAYLKGGLDYLGDARIQNLKRVRDYGFSGKTLLLRAPMYSEISQVINFANVSLNSELDTLKLLDEESKKQGKTHGYIIMVDVGDRREGVLPEDVKSFVKEAIKLENVKFEGLGLNVGCFGGVLPTTENAQILIDLKSELEQEGIEVPTISGGSTCGLNIMFHNQLPEGINQLRVGEAFLIGNDSVRETPIPGTYQDTFRLVTEIIEIKDRPSQPEGEIGKDPFGNVPEFPDRGIRKRAIAAIGKQDVAIGSLLPEDEQVTIEGASSDHLILDITDSDHNYKIGDEITFDMEYGAVLFTMTSPYVQKEYIWDSI
ncbi:alanine/ornithine racemase family PLP-dependent enzyme [Natranaerobius thermophilus]|uniref:Alanine racemase domain protein n=1 Tax=Natranaerobius thermophilus (strain ATCC BAA-1301 / DSM 18059 / JW/NM-WN-LF) TaxID=457570 RepID=B2A1Y2_NATTJ|nr:alanine/ornithine racemase family PLP-dependent enzyme [Natranaerobius thermophilus]ACB84787.1 alanine racemase domain protein [Natranaerobius thermophilus JW/NM-WN-LF]